MKTEGQEGDKEHAAPKTQERPNHAGESPDEAEDDEVERAQAHT